MACLVVVYLFRFSAFSSASAHAISPYHGISRGRQCAGLPWGMHLPGKGATGFLLGIGRDEETRVEQPMIESWQGGGCREGSQAENGLLGR